MLSILGRIGHLLRHSGFSVDQLDVIFTGPDMSFIAPSRLLSGPCTMRKMDKNMCKYLLRCMAFHILGTGVPSSLSKA